MSTIVKLTEDYVDVPKNAILLEITKRPEESKLYEWALEQGKELISILEKTTGSTAIWLDPDPMHIGIALMLTTWLSTQARTVNWIVQVKQIGWVLQKFQEEGNDYLKGENT